MIKTVKQFSFSLSKETISELTLIAHRYSKVKNYIYARFGSINGLQYIDNPREVRDEWIKSKFAIQWKLSARYWKLALSEAFSNIKTNWEQTKKSIRKNINQRDLTKDEKHYINYILRSNRLLHKVLINKPEIIEKFLKLDQSKLNRLIKRLVRKYHHKSFSKKKKSFMLDSAMYRFVNDGIEITSLTPRKRLKINLTDATKRDGNIRVVIDKFNQRVEIHSTTKVEAKEHNNTNIVAIDKGFSKMLATSNKSFYGIKLSKKLIELSEKLNKKNRQRNKLRSLYKKYLEKNNLKKAKKLKRFNLGAKKYNRQKSKIKSNIESYINKSINEFIENEKPKVVVVENLTFVTKNKNEKPAKLNRWLNSWLKGYIQERLEYKLSANGAELAIVNPAYTSQICHLCNYFGKRKGDRFYCETHGVVDADYNASVNILQRYYDNEINLFTSYKKVKQILISRLEAS